jgi:hypothetical protein
MSSQYSPAEIEVTTIVDAIRKESPTLGLQKVLFEIREREPTWTLSEKVRYLSPSVTYPSV